MTRHGTESAVAPYVGNRIKNPGLHAESQLFYQERLLHHRQMSALLYVIGRLSGGRAQHAECARLTETQIKSTVAPYIIGISPPTIMAGLYTLINFSWFIMITIESSIILEVTDFHFTPQQTAAFIFASWIGAILAVIYGTLLNDRIPMYLSRRSGMWHPEYRLHTAWFPGVFATPVGCGIFGAALIYKLHYMVLALGTFFIALGGVASVPVSINYVIECFRHYPQEVGAALNLYRLCFGLAIPFFYDQWEETVGVNWVYGMSAFISLFGFMLVVLLMWKGPAIRKLSLWKDTSAGEEGTKVA